MLYTMACGTLLHSNIAIAALCFGGIVWQAHIVCVLAAPGSVLQRNKQLQPCYQRPGRITHWTYPSGGEQVLPPSK